MLKTWEFSQNSPIIPGIRAELVNFSRTERTEIMEFLSGLYHTKLP